jgi:hypothetical protein
MSLPKRARALGSLPRAAVYKGQRALYRTTRLADRLFHTNLAVYGWAFYFAHLNKTPTEQPAYLNVCMSCGCGHPAADLSPGSRSIWRCSVCDTVNPFVKPFRNAI